MMKTLAVRALGALLVGALSFGCSDDDDDIEEVIPGIETGTLEQSWTIEGTTDVAKCVQYNADRMRLVIFDASGSIHATEFAPCGQFGAALDLKTDTYTANATFIDAQGAAVSQTLSIPRFSIAEDLPTRQTIDFGATAFTP